MPSLKDECDGRVTPRQRRAQEYAFGIWRKIEATAPKGFGQRILGGDYLAVVNAVYDQWLEDHPDAGD